LEEEKEKYNREHPEKVEEVDEKKVVLLAVLKINSFLMNF
jgi:hypothetical protein